MAVPVPLQAQGLQEEAAEEPAGQLQEETIEEPVEPAGKLQEETIEEPVEPAGASAALAETGGDLVISNENDWAMFAEGLNENGGYAGRRVKLAKDLDFSGVGFPGVNGELWNM